MEGLSLAALVFTVYFSALIAFCYAKRKNMDTAKTFYINLLVLYGILLFILSLFPISIESKRGMEFVPLKRLFETDNLNSLLLLYSFNFALTIPLGFLSNMQSKLKGEPAFLKTLLTVLLISFTAEFLQLILPIGRMCGIDDVLTNTLGGLLGFTLFELFYGGKKMQRFLRNILYR